MECGIEEYVKELKKELEDRAKKPNSRAVKGLLNQLNELILANSVTTNLQINKLKEQMKLKEQQKIDKLGDKDKKRYIELSKIRVQSNPDYQNYMLNWLKSSTNATIENSADILQLTGLLTNQLKITAGYYVKDVNHIKVLDNVKRVDVESKVRYELYDNYLKANNKTLEDAYEEVIEVYASKEAQKMIDLLTTEVLKLVDQVKGSHTLLHELVHANTQAFMEQNPNHKATQRVKELYEIALKQREQIDIVTTEGDIIHSYWSTNIDEFIAEGLSNPKVIAALMQVPVEGKERLSVFKELINAVVDMLGLKGQEKDNVYNLLLDSMMVIVQEQGGKETLHRMEVQKTQRQVKQKEDTMTANKILDEVQECLKG